MKSHIRADFLKPSGHKVMIIKKTAWRRHATWEKLRSLSRNSANEVGFFVVAVNKKAIVFQ